LEEAIEADLLLHVIDGASPDVANQRATVYHVLRELGMTDAQLRSRVVEVWNKADLLEESSVPRLAASPLEHGPGSQAATASLYESDDSDPDWKPSPEAEDGVVAKMPSPEGQPSVNSVSDERPTRLSGDVQIAPDAPADTSPDATGLVAPAHDADQHSQCAPRVGADTTRASTDADEGLCAAAVSTSTLSGVGLDELLALLDRKLAVKLGTQELTDHTAFLGPRLLSRSLFGSSRTSTADRVARSCAHVSNGCS